MSQAQVQDVASTDKIPAPETGTLDEHSKQLRDALSALVASKVKALPQLSDKLEEFYTEIPVRDGWLSRCHVVRPRSLDRPRPLIVHFYGGGFGAGDCDQLTVPARDFAEQFNAVVVLPSYRLTPEVRFPVPQQDGWDVISFLSAHAEGDARFLATLSVEAGGGFIVGGVSAGGTHAALAPGIDMLLSHGIEPGSGSGSLQGMKPLPNKITGTFVAIAMLLFEPMVPAEYAAQFTSRIDNADHPDFDTAGCREIVARLHVSDFHSVWLSPFNALKQVQRQQGTGTSTITHPRTYVQTCQLDPLRDDGLIYEKYLREQLGVQSKIDVFKDDGHAAWTVMDFPNRSTNPTIPEVTMDGMRWLLGADK